MMRRGEGAHRSKTKIPKVGKNKDLQFALGLSSKGIERLLKAGVAIRIESNRYAIWETINNFKNHSPRRTTGWDGRQFRNGEKPKTETNRKIFFNRSARIEKANEMLFCSRCKKWSKLKFWPKTPGGERTETCCKQKDLDYNRRLKQHGLKKCWSCNEIKQLVDFPKNKTRGTEQGNCRDCVKASGALKASRVRRQKWIDDTDDGTINKHSLMLLFGEARKCPVCLKTMRRNDKHLDHKKPLSRGGAHTLQNVWVICSECNLNKGTKTLQEWLNIRAANTNVGSTEGRNSRAS